MMNGKKELPDDLKDIECRNPFCISGDGEVCLLYDRKSQLNKCVFKKLYEKKIRNNEKWSEFEICYCNICGNDIPVKDFDYVDELKKTIVLQNNLSGDVNESKTLKKNTK